MNEDSDLNNAKIQELIVRVFLVIVMVFLFLKILFF
jgi:hypothetical protein